MCGRQCRKTGSSVLFQDHIGTGGGSPVKALLGLGSNPEKDKLPARRAYGRQESLVIGYNISEKPPNKNWTDILR